MPERDVPSIRRWLQSGRGHAHFVGIGGVGMAGLAFLASKTGIRVSGCDLLESRITAWLRANGIEVFTGHDPVHIDDTVTAVVRTTAVKSNAPEVSRAREQGIPVYMRGAVLAALIDGRASIAVTGTHGKTTTATFTAQLLTACGRDPSFCIGAEVAGDGAVAGAGGGPLLVAEADESDGTVALYRPETAVLTNIEYDHMEHFRNEADMENCFLTFARAARKNVVWCKDDPGLCRVLSDLNGGVTFGFSGDADCRAAVETMSADSATIRLFWRGDDQGLFTYAVAGRHNALNAASAAAVAHLYGCSFDEIRKGFSSLRLARRRFEQVCDLNGVRVISDYAHHPTEIRALIDLARMQPHKRIIAVFQPHRYTRTLALGPQFVPACAGVDQLILAPVYPASEAPLDGGRIGDLHGHFLKANALNVELAESLQDAWNKARIMLQPGDLFLVIGAGDVEVVSQWAKDYLLSYAP
ncbi:MAG: UDP-N-acetylmuramate--L-alanine ligase [Kiritimatiellia bacterium]